MHKSRQFQAKHGAPRRRRAGVMAAGATVLCTGLAGGLVTLSAGTAAAFSAVESQGYTISGASAVVSNLSAAVSPATASTAQSTVTGNYTLKFQTPTALSVGGANPSTLQISSAAAPGGISLAGVTSVGVADLTDGFTFDASGSDLTVSATQLVVKLGNAGTGGAVNAGDTLLLTFAAANPAVNTSTSYTFELATSASPNAQAAPPVTISPASAPASATANTQGTGRGANFTISGVVVPSGIASRTSLTLQACTGSLPTAPCTPGSGTASGTGGILFSSTVSSYSVVDNTTSRALAVAGVSPVSTASGATDSGGVRLDLSTSTPLTVGDSITITAVGLTPNSPESDYLVAGFPGGSPSVVGAGPLVFGNSVSNVAVAVSTPTENAASTYSVTFTTSATGAMPSGGKITLVGPKQTSFAHVTGALVTVTGTQSTQVIPVSSGTPGLSVSTNNTASDTLTLATTLPVQDNQSLTLTIFGVLNPPAGSYAGSSGLGVATTADPVASQNSSAYAIAPAVVNTQAPAVTVTPANPGVLATYTISSFKAASNLSAGVDTLEVSGPTGTQFPGTATLVDATNSTNQVVTAKSGLGGNDVIYVLASGVNAGDVLSLSMTNVINPPGTPAGSTYNLFLGADTVASNTAINGGQGLAANAVPATTTTTAPHPTTTTPHKPKPKPKPKPVVAALTAKAHMGGRNHIVGIRLRCRQAACTGFIRFVHGKVGFGNKRYHLGAGQTAVFGVKLDAAALRALAHARRHTVGVTQITSVARGATRHRPVTLIG